MLLFFLVIYFCQISDGLVETLNSLWTEKSYQKIFGKQQSNFTFF